MRVELYNPTINIPGTVMRCYNFRAFYETIYQSLLCRFVEVMHDYPLELSRLRIGFNEK